MAGVSTGSGWAARNKAGGGTIQIADVNNHMTAICKIEHCGSDDDKPGGGTGFIGRISNKNLLVLLTCNHVIPRKEVAETASFTFGYTDEKHQGTTIAADDLLDVSQWWSDSFAMEPLVGLDFTMIGVKEDQIKELNIYPFELAPTEVAKDDQLMIPQHPLTRDYQQPTPMGISLGPCKNIMGFLVLYDCCTFNGSSGSPVVKVVDGKLQVMAIHRGLIHTTYYNCSTLFASVYSHVGFDDKEVPKVTKDTLLEFAGKVKWQPVEMFDLLKTLEPVRADWEDLAYNLIKKDQATLKGLVRGIKKDCFHNTANDDGLRKVVEKWHGRTGSKERTWQTLLDVAKKLDDHTLSKYLDKNGIPHNSEPQMHHVIKWCRMSSCRSDWYDFACKLLPREEARAIESNLRGNGTKECLRKLLEKWMNITPSSTWGMIVDALAHLPDATEVREKIIEKFKNKI